MAKKKKSKQRLSSKKSAEQQPLQTEHVEPNGPHKPNSEQHANDKESETQQAETVETSTEQVEANTSDANQDGPSQDEEIADDEESYYGMDATEQEVGQDEQLRSLSSDTEPATDFAEYDKLSVEETEEAVEPEDQLALQTTEESQRDETQEQTDTLEAEKREDANEETVEVGGNDDAELGQNGAADEAGVDYTKPLAESSAQIEVAEEDEQPLEQQQSGSALNTEKPTVLEEARSELQLADAPGVEVPSFPDVPSVNELVSSTEGPYTLSSLHLDIPSSPGTMTSICHYDNNIYVGTSLGYILCYTLLPDSPQKEYILTSQVAFHSTREYPITSFLPLPTLQLLLSVSGSLLQCFTLPVLTPLSIGRVKDVESIELDLDGRAKCDDHGVHVVVMTKTQIRIVNVTRQALRLVKDVKVGVKCGKRRGDRMVVAGDQYEFLDLNKELNYRMPLFPVNTAGLDDTHLKPFVEGVGRDEFLLVCGTGKEEPAMGLVVNLKGDVSRGTIPMMSYPDAVITDEDTAMTVTGGEIRLYSLDDQREVQSWRFKSDVRTMRVFPVSVSVNALVDLITLRSILGEKNHERDKRELEFARKISQVKSSVVCFCDDFVKLIVPQSRLQRLQSTTEIKTLERELASSQATTELTVVEVEYLNLRVSLLRLLDHRYDQALESWTNGTLDPRILIYAFGYQVFGEVYMFGGLHPLLESLRSSIKETAFMNFFELFLKRWLSKHSVENKDLLATLETVSVLYHIDSPHQLLQTLRCVTHIDPMPILESHNRYLALAHAYSDSDPARAISIHKDLVDNIISDLGFDKSNSLHTICELANKTGEDTRRDTGMWLLKHDAKLAITFMNSSKLSLHSLQTGMNRTEEVRNVIESIDDIGLKYEYMSQVFVSMGQEKMKLGLKKGLYKSLLKSLSAAEKAMRVEAQKR